MSNADVSPMMMQEFKRVAHDPNIMKAATVEDEEDGLVFLCAGLFLDIFLVLFE